MLGLADDPDPQVRLQLALVLGNWNDPRAGQALARIARRDAGRSAGSARRCSARPCRTWRRCSSELVRGGGGAAAAAVVEPLVVAGGLDRRTARRSSRSIRAIGTPAGQGGSYAPWQFAALRGLLEAAGRSKHPVELDARAGAAQAARRRAQAGPRRRGRRGRPARGGRACSGSRRRRKPEDRDLLVGLLKPRRSRSVAAGGRRRAGALGRSQGPRPAAPRLEDLLAAGPRRRSSTSLLSRKAWTASLLSSLEDTLRAARRDRPGPSQRLLDAARRGHPRAGRGRLRPPGRQRVRRCVDAYRPALALKGDPAAGKAVFKRVCATCHRLGDVGVEVGPDLGGARRQDRPSRCLIAILDPNRAFESQYANFTVATVDGRVSDRPDRQRDGHAVTLRRQEGKEDVVLRTEIEEMAASGQSLMPEGLEKDLTPRDLADLIAFLEGDRTAAEDASRAIIPRTVKPEPDGTIVLAARTPRSTATRLVFEPQHGNLGYWIGRQRSRRLEVRGRRARQVRRLARLGLPQRRRRQRARAQPGRPADPLPRSAAPGTWDDYCDAAIGELDLTAGTHRLEVRPAARPENALLDLRRIELRPRKPAPRSARRARRIEPDRTIACSC